MGIYFPEEPPDKVNHHSNPPGVKCENYVYPKTADTTVHIYWDCHLCHKKF